MRRKILLYALTALTLSAIILIVCTAMGETAKWPTHSSGGEKTNSKLKADVGNASEGYFMAAVKSSTKHNMKLRVEKDGQTLTYDLDKTGKYEVFPFQLGSGKYGISLWENVSGKKYSAAGKISVNVKLKREDGAFLYPNQYVNYGKNDQVVGMSLKVCRDKSGKEAYTAIKQYITESFRYDYVKAATIKPSVLPDISTCFSKKSGVCQDLSAVMVSMLRVQGIPARLVIGYADKIYHAWVVCEVDGKKVLFDPTAAVSKSKNAANYSVERYY
ncbi:MAG: transglutaminase domain-containing protein [Clostridia bacterium]|nr:transglutaminase domain-containing protein [Clostridia bacterium]